MRFKILIENKEKYPIRQKADLVTPPDLNQPPAASARNMVAKGIKGKEIGIALAEAEEEFYNSLLKESKRKKIKLIIENFNLGKGHQIDYTSFELDSASRVKLLTYAPRGWVRRADHMTVIKPTEQKYRMPSRWLDFKGGIKVVGIAKNDRVVTALVDLEGLPVPTKGVDMPHITIATAPGVKPIESNKFSLSDFERLDEPIVVSGKMKEKISRGIEESTKIFCDMDGVLANFADAGIERVNKYISGEIETTSRSVNKATRRLKKDYGDDFRVTSEKDLKNKFVKPILMKIVGSDAEKWFSELEPLSDAGQLWEFINSLGREVNILTAGIDTPTNPDGSRNGKQAFVKQYFNPPPKNFYLEKAHTKQDYAINEDGTPNILIDDKKSTIDEWNARGGIGILHIPNNAAATIKKLKQLLK